MLSDFRLKYILIGRNNKISTTVLPSTNRSVIIFSLFGRTVVENRRRKQLNLFCLENVVYYELRDKIVVQSLVINIGTCFARSYNVFLADDLSYGNVFLELRSRKTTITEIVRSKNIIAACKTYSNVNH